MPTYSTNNGKRIELDDATVEDLDALAIITRETTAALAARAVEQLRRDLVPSAARARTTPATTTGGRSNRKAEDGANANGEAQA
jgi:predicted transcriptional regulator